MGFSIFYLTCFVAFNNLLWGNFFLIGLYQQQRQTIYHIYFVNEKKNRLFDYLKNIQYGNIW